MLILPASLAPVRPRVYSADSEEFLPLDEIIQGHVETHTCGAIRLMGPAGTGKTTALAHLAARFAGNSVVMVGEQPAWEEVRDLATRYLVIYAASKANTDKHLAILHMAPWGKDELIEYLLAVHKEKCASVMARLEAQRVPFECDYPSVWRVVLDQMAAEEALPDARAALLRHFRTGLADDRLFHQLENLCLHLKLTDRPLTTGEKEYLSRCLEKANLKKLLRHWTVCLQLAVDLMLRELRTESRCNFLRHRLGRDLIRTAAPLIRIDGKAQESLRIILTKTAKKQPMAASLLHQAGTGWVPGNVRNLAGAYLNGAAWPDVDLSRACLAGADLSNSYLCRANLDFASAIGANLAQSRLDQATLLGLDAQKANFTGANLSGVQACKANFSFANFMRACLEDAHLKNSDWCKANLAWANFRGASLCQANLTRARIAGADFSAADLSEAILSDLCLRAATFYGANFSEAQLERCDLEYMDLPEVSFARANLSGALLTGCNMPLADFTGAWLCKAGLADINWEGACLRDANLTGASFHLGSSRSGMLFTPYPCEGSKTGFYTDDREEQHFKAPEEIRKANLRGADLRGACVQNVDFYLVDLRDALFDPKLEAHLRASGAILEDRG